MRIIDPNTGKTYLEKRRKRYNEEGQPRGLTFSCFGGYKFFAKERTRIWLRDALNEARQKFGFQLWAYVIMPEHVHLLVYPGKAARQMSDFLKEVKEPVARAAIAYLAEHAPHWLERLTVREGRRVRHRFWQPGGGYDRNVTSAKVLRAMIEYIHANPVRRGLVARAVDWEWSSARWYAGVRKIAIEMDRMVLDELVWD